MLSLKDVFSSSNPHKCHVCWCVRVCMPCLCIFIHIFFFFFLVEFSRSPVCVFAYISLSEQNGYEDDIKGVIKSAREADISRYMTDLSRAFLHVSTFQV